MKTKTFAEIFDLNLRTVQHHLLEYHEELDKLNIIQVRNKNGKRLKYDIIDGNKLYDIIKSKPFKK